ncbi:MAG: hypothetical protein JJU28_24745 [Cyclobacteriaceae bacterium]|nr:hypothetical protein [Cyclobacteriaceae bacterium]
MKKKILFAIPSMMVMLYLLAGCAKVPQAEIDAAVAAIDKVKTAEAALYVPDQLKALEDSLSAVKVAVESQKSKLMADYGQVKNTLAWISTQAPVVETSATKQKEQMRTEIESLIAEVNALLEENAGLMLIAPKGKEGKVALETIGNELNAIKTAVGEVQNASAEGQLPVTIDKIRAAKVKAQSLKDELNAAIAKTKKS